MIGLERVSPYLLGCPFSDRQGSNQHWWQYGFEKEFSTGRFGNPTLTEEIHSYRIAAKYGPICSKDESDDE
jgi:hypothetical protein